MSLFNKIRDYDPCDEDSILEYANHLVGNTLGEAIAQYGEQVDSGRGSFGITLEVAYFGYNANSASRPDFEEVGIELKSSALKRLKNGSLRAKERISLSMIDYNMLSYLGNDLFSTPFWGKIEKMLLVFYEYSKDRNFLSYPIRYVGIWEFPKEDKVIIEKDWLLIKSYVDNGKAHKLSESLTSYLGAATKGSNSNDLTTQPYSSAKAMRRAFALKTTYVNKIVEEFSTSRYSRQKGVLNLDEISSFTLEGAFERRVKRFYGKSVEEIANSFNGVSVNLKAKGAFAKLSRLMLGEITSKSIREFELAGIVLKTIRVDVGNNLKEAISFPAFKYVDIVNEKWLDSVLFNTLDSLKFAFAVFRYDENKQLNFERLIFWSMPSEDIEKSKEVWLATRDSISSGQIVKSIGNNGRRTTYFVKSSDEMCIHVRPHAKNTDDSFPLPIRDRLTGLKEYTKHSFWLNQGYMKKILFG